MVVMSAISEIRQWYSFDYDIQPNKMAEIEVLEIEILTVINFFPRPVLASGYCRCLCVCVCINHMLVCTITLVQRSKTPWLRSLLFWGAIDLDLQGQI